MPVFKKTTRAQLAKYAALLGRDSLTAEALRLYDRHREEGRKVEVYQRLTGFSIRSYDSRGEHLTKHFG